MVNEYTLIESIRYNNRIYCIFINKKGKYFYMRKVSDFDFCLLSEEELEKVKKLNFKNNYCSRTK